MVLERHTVAEAGRGRKPVTRMSSSFQNQPAEALFARAFVTTRWSVVLAASRGESKRADEALETLCRAYWYPLYAFARRHGHTPEDAQDLTQAFFARLLEKKYLGLADPKRGKFRCFLLSSLKHFLVNEWEKAGVQKRGGDVEFVPLDSEAAETRYQFEPAHALAPDKIFERRWALILLERVLAELRDEYATAGREAFFDQLKPALTGEKTSLSYAALATQLNMSEGSVKVAVHRLRRRYRALFRSEVADTVANPNEVEQELRHIVAVLSG
jgi:RNA polymerase sigma factor (sigma-70 family)